MYMWLVEEEAEVAEEVELALQLKQDLLVHLKAKKGSMLSLGKKLLQLQMWSLVLSLSLTIKLSF